MQLPSPAEPAPLLNVPVESIEGQATSLKTYVGKVLLIVNVASECGYTPQYEGLEALYQKYREQGLVVLGFPSNDFGGQEPGSNAEIKQFCERRFKVSFPMFSKVRVKGPEAHPLFLALSSSNGAVKWNFGKYLVSRRGEVLAKFDSDVEPDSATLVSAIEKALAQQ